MARATYVPITGTVLDWAITESGHSRVAVAENVKAEVAEVASWIAEDARPTLTQFRKLGEFLKRPTAALLLPRPPAQPSYGVQFRYPLDPDARDCLNPAERRYLREAARVQRTVSWIRSELDHQAKLPTFPRYSVGTSDPQAAGRATRGDLGVTLEEQQGWPHEWDALRAWRKTLEAADILVFSFPMGRESCRGFSIWEARAPVIAINSAWGAPARIFTLLHEYGHLATRTSSACLEGGSSGRRGGPDDPTERWCEEFSAATLLPVDAVKELLAEKFGLTDGLVDDLDVASAVARRFRVSLRAATVRLIEMGFATWDLYRTIPPASDVKGRGGGAGGRRRPKIRLDEYGAAAVASLFKAVDHDILSRSDVAGYLDLSASEAETLRKSLD